MDLVEGLNTTDTGWGRLSTNLPNEFIAQTEIISGGYNAELGRATGGIINVVTKTGSNELHGSVFAYWRPGALTASAKAVEIERSAIDVRNDLDNQVDIGAELGGPIDLAHVKAHDLDVLNSVPGSPPTYQVNRTPIRHPNFGRPTLRQSPRTMQVGIRLTF